MKISDLQGKHIAILGFGREGKSTLDFLMRHEIGFASLTILDVNKNLKSSSLVDTVAGEAYLDELEKYDVIFKSAGIPFHEKLALHSEKIITQAQFFFDNYKGKVIALTATKGKSTMVSLIFYILKNAGYSVELVGNIGNPVLDGVDFEKGCDFVIMELSSYMLSTLTKKNFISVLGSIFPEHMDWHGSFKAYSQAKRNILEGSEHNIVYQKTIEEYKLGDKYNNLISYGPGGKYHWYYGFFMEDDKKLFLESDRNILGEHNLDNICAALAVADLIGLSLDVCHTSIKAFKGLPYRMESVGEHAGITWVNDAISTTPQSTIQAIRSFGKKIGAIFLGGTDRGYDFEELVEYLIDYKIHTVILFPDTGEKILRILQSQIKDLKNRNILQTSCMKEAVQFALDHTSQGQIALLSTASPSYSIWKDFEEKGDLFKQYIQELTLEK